MSAFLSVSQAQTILLEAFRPLETEWVSLRQACGRVLSAPLTAPFDLPPFSNSGMDGFAVQSADTQAASFAAPVTLKIIGDIPAGSNPAFRLSTGQAARIMSGAPIPEGADAVVIVEETNLHDQGLNSPLTEQIDIYSAVQPGGSIRPRGEDSFAGAEVFPASHRLRPQDVGLLASLGFFRVSVYRQPRVALLSSGDELLAPDEPLRPGMVHDANSYLLAALLEKFGAIVTQAGFVPDDETAIRTHLDELAASGIDLLITSAGVSLGAFDFVRKVIREQGVLTFWRVNLRPGKPLTFGNYRGVPVIGLPGNPVAVFVGSSLFIIPALKKMTGRADLQMVKISAKLLEPVESDGRESYLRANLQRQADNWVVKLTGHQGSGNLFALTRSNALLILPSGVKSLPAGADVIVHPLFDEVI